MPTTRGERNNNPCNLRDFGIAWEGLDDPPHDAGGYCRFVSAAAGLRAGVRDLHTKWSRGLKTTRLIISTFAPPSENATEAYILDLCARLGLSPDDPLDLSNSGLLQRLVTAVICHENGRCVYPSDLIAHATASALLNAG